MIILTQDQVLSLHKDMIQNIRISPECTFSEILSRIDTCVFNVCGKILL